MTATLDHIPGGRLVHFLHPSVRNVELSAYELPLQPQDDRVEQMIEVLEIILTLWTSEDPVDHDGAYNRLRQARCRPTPMQIPHQPVWLGLTTEAGFTACTNYAQGWNAIPVPMTTLQQQLAALEAACSAVGRPMGEIRFS